MKLPHSFDVIGDIIILNEKGTKKQAQQLLKLHKNIKVVLKRAGIYKGKYRTRKLAWLAGEKRKETTHKESNVLIKLNVEKCYFSGRISNERIRIYKQVKPNESILVMFSGVAPLPLIISKNTKAKEIYAIEINLMAYKYAKENVKQNKLSNIKLYKGDVRKTLPNIKKKFDRILMPLPKSSELFLDLAKKKIKKHGIIHLYQFLEEKNINIKHVNEILKKHLKKYKILKIVKCGVYAPRVYRICIDIKL